MCYELPVSTPGGDQLLEGGVLGGVVGGLVLPEAPDDCAPGAAGDADRVWVGAAAGAGALVDVGGPGVVVAAGVGEGADRVAEVVVAGPAEAGAFGFAGFDGDGGLAGVGGEGGVAVAAVADLGEHRRGGDRGFGVFEEGLEGGSVGVLVQRAADLAGELADPGDDRPECGDEREHDLAARFALQRAGASLGGVLETDEQLAWVLRPQY